MRPYVIGMISALLLCFEKVAEGSKQEKNLWRTGIALTLFRAFQVLYIFGITA